MMKAPTNTAMKPNVRSAGVRKLLISLLIASAERFASCFPVLTSMPGPPTTSRTAAAACVWLTPGRAATSIRLILPAASYQRWMSARPASMIVVPPVETGYLMIAAIVTWWMPDAVTSCTRCPGDT
jgi:hypothetical protein